MSDDDAALLRVREVAKSYGPVTALRSVDLDVVGGEIHALLGANGAGKSTLVKILSGVVQPDSGSVALRGQEVSFRSPVSARAAGLSPVFQDPALVADLTLAQNFVLTGTDGAAVRAQFPQLGLEGLDLAQRVNQMPLSLLRMIDLARALAHEPALLLLDELTAALPTDMAERVFTVMRDFRASGRSVLFISHRLTEVQAMCDRVTVLRDGRAVDTHRTSEGGERRIVAAMLGERAARAQATVQAQDQRPARAPQPRLVVDGLAAGRKLMDATFSLDAGEILGVVGLEAQGQEELFSALAGDVRASAGSITIEGRPVRARHPFQAIRRGISLVPADRSTAVLPQRSVRENLALPLYATLSKWGPIDRKRERRYVDRTIDELEIDSRGQADAKQLSGGNQQKLTIGRWLVAGYDVLLCFDPTRGIDVGTKHQIYRLLRQQAEEGRSVLMFTSEMQEVPLVCHRVVVLYGGRIVDEMPAAQASEERLLESAHGLVREVV